MDLSTLHNEKQEGWTKASVHSEDLFSEGNELNLRSLTKESKGPLQDCKYGFRILSDLAVNRCFSYWKHV